MNNDIIFMFVQLNFMFLHFFGWNNKRVLGDGIPGEKKKWVLLLSVPEVACVAKYMFVVNDDERIPWEFNNEKCPEKCKTFGWFTNI